MTAEQLPCGCVIDSVGDSFVVQPCALDCRWVIYAMGEARRGGKPIHYMVDPDIDEEVR